VAHVGLEDNTNPALKVLANATFILLLFVANKNISFQHRKKCFKKFICKGLLP